MSLQPSHVVPGRCHPPRKKILLAAENPAVRQFVQSSVERVQHTVVTADLPTAYPMAKANPVDLIIVELGPSLIACEVVKAIRVDPTVAHLPIIMLYPKSADARHSPPNVCSLPGDACTFLGKPHTRVELWTLIDDPRPGDARDHPRASSPYRPGDWPELEQQKRQPWWRR